MLIKDFRCFFSKNEEEREKAKKEIIEYSDKKQFRFGLIDFLKAINLYHIK